MKKRLTAILLLLCSVSALVSCSGGGGESDASGGSAGSVGGAAETTAEETLYAPDELPALDFKGKEFRLLIGSSFADKFHTEAETGEVVNDSLYAANSAVAERLNIKISYPEILYENWNHNSTYVNALTSSVLAGDNAWEVISAWSNMGLALMNGILSDLSDMPYISLDKPWWMSSVAEQLTLGGKLPIITGDLSPTVTRNMMCIYFNKKLTGSLSLDDPYKLVTDGGWTFDKLLSMSEAAYADLNGDSKVDSGDRVGFSLDNPNYITGFYSAFKLTALEKRKTGLAFVYGNKSNTDKIEKLITALNGTKGVAKLDMTGTGVFGEGCDYFRNGTVLFQGGWICSSESYRDVSFDFGILPYPKYDDAQEGYGTTLLTVTTFAVPASNTDAEFTGASLEALSSEFYRTVTPAYYEVALKIKYSRDDETSRMLDLLRESASYDIGLLLTGTLDYVVDVQLKNAVTNNTPGWSAIMAALQEKTSAKLADIWTVYERLA